MQRFTIDTGQVKNERMRIVFSILFISLALTSCEKEGEKKTGTITSAWKETDHYFSIGGPIVWKITEPSEAETIEFKKDSVFSSSIHTNLNRYIIEPVTSSTAAKLKLYEAGNRDTTYWLINTVTQNTLDIGFSNCIEGCGKRFSRLEVK
jgi:hypothetical protein